MKDQPQKKKKHTSAERRLARGGLIISTETVQHGMGITHNVPLRFDFTVFLIRMYLFCYWGRDGSVQSRHHGRLGTEIKKEKNKSKEHAAAFGKGVGIWTARARETRVWDGSEIQGRERSRKKILTNFKPYLNTCYREH